MAIIDLYKPGQCIDQYTVIKTLSASKHSHVYLVQGSHVHKQQVLKLHAGEPSTPQSDRFVAQANLLLAFSAQPNIVDVLHVGSIVNTSLNKTNERPFMLMPYYPQTLHDLLAIHHQKLSFITSLNIINHIIDALHSIHHAGIVHLDIKPQNIFLDENNNALLADFDNAKVLKGSPLLKRFGLTMSDESADTRLSPNYASPEQIASLYTSTNAVVQNESDNARQIPKHTGSISFPSDMYSLGALWYRMLTGDTPTPGDSLAKALIDIAPSWAIDIIVSLVNTEVQNRPSVGDLKSLILSNMLTPEVNQTLDASAFDVPKQSQEENAAPVALSSAPSVLQQHLHSKRFALPLLAILLVIIYWTFQHKLTPSTAPQPPMFNTSVGIIKEDAENHTHNTDNSPHSGTEGKVETVVQMSASSDQSQSDKPQPHNTGAYTMYIEQANSSSKLSIDWVVYANMPGLRVMTTEVSNSLFALCAKEGACALHKDVTASRRTAKIDLPGHPKVNVNWFEVTQQFIPWLSEKTQTRLSLPTKAQWLIMSGPIQRAKHMPQGAKLAIQCKNCNHSLARQYAGTTMPVKAINADENGLYHLLGNVQEWLSDCWQQTSADKVIVERCDQAAVAGGSWMSQKSQIQEHAFTQLLKSARTPTTGFRLVELIDD